MPDNTLRLCLYKASNGGGSRASWKEPPELTRAQGYGPEADVYSFGFILWKLWYGKHINSTTTIEDMQAAGAKAFSIPRSNRPRTDDVWCKIILNCWAQMKEERPTAEECVDHLSDLKKKLLGMNN